MNYTLPIKGKDALSRIVPHQGRMLLIDEITAFDKEAKTLSAGATADEGSPFFTGEGTPCYVAFELIAQSISAYSFLSGINTDGKPSIGFILRLSHFTVSRKLLEKNEKVVITITEECTLGDSLYSFQGNVRAKNDIIAKGQILVMSTDDPQAILEGKK